MTAFVLLPPIPPHVTVQHVRILQTDAKPPHVCSEAQSARFCLPLPAVQSSNVTVQVGLKEGLYTGTSTCFSLWAVTLSVSHRCFSSQILSSSVSVILYSSLMHCFPERSASCDQFHIVYLKLCTTTQSIFPTLTLRALLAQSGFKCNTKCLCYFQTDSVSFSHPVPML